MTAEEMADANSWGGDFGSRYMAGYFAEYVNDWDILEDDQVYDMLCCIHDGFGYQDGLIRGWNSVEEFNFFDKYGLLEDSFTEFGNEGVKLHIRYFKKEFRDTFLEEDWYYKSLEEEAANWYDAED